MRAQAMAEAKRLRLDAVHQDDAHARERVVVELAVRGARHLAPGEYLAIEAAPLFRREYPRPWSPPGGEGEASPRDGNRVRCP